MEILIVSSFFSSRVFLIVFSFTKFYPSSQYSRFSFSRDCLDGCFVGWLAWWLELKKENFWIFFLFCDIVFVLREKIRVMGICHHHMSAAVAYLLVIFLYSSFFPLSLLNILGTHTQQTTTTTAYHITFNGTRSGGPERMRVRVELTWDFWIFPKNIYMEIFARFFESKKFFFLSMLESETLSSSHQTITITILHQF